jgi:Fe-Mn family superoxide dismutase
MKTKQISRREALKTAALAGAVLAAAPRLFAQPAPAAPGGPAMPITSAAAPAPSGPFTLPPLPYAYDALEPHIDALTMHIHHDKHHKAYVDNLNRAVASFAPEPIPGIEVLLTHMDGLQANVRTAIRNNGGGHYNHSLFWQMMKPSGGGAPAGDLGKAIDASFGSFDDFKKKFSATALKVFGSGWTWLTLNGGKLMLETTPNQDSPLTDGHQVLLGLDVWEHAYYLKYQNVRAEYAGAWWNVVNWDFVADRYNQSKA